jgi:hypothetical protein
MLVLVGMLNSQGQTSLNPLLPIENDCGRMLPVVLMVDYTLSKVLTDWYFNSFTDHSQLQVCRQMIIVQIMWFKLKTAPAL